MIQNITDSLKEAQNVLADLISNKTTLKNIESAANILIESLKNEHRILSCGNGGSIIFSTFTFEDNLWLFSSDCAWSMECSVILPTTLLLS